ncbi:MAG: SusF/SusE family outer membrane protein [Sphingobacteriaceae bacterium]|nr:MAG: SusF/SusE family outer membrane protein [Sphingobacteriaceae bacterium]
MNPFVFKSLVFSLIALMLWSCKKDEVRSVAAANATGGTLKASTTTVMPERATQDENLITIDFTKADFGFNAAAKNILEIAVAGTSFSAPKEVPFDANVLSKTWTGLDFNVLLLALNLPFDAPTDIEVRIKSEVSTAITPVYSNVITLSAKPYPLITHLYVPGEYQGWNPATADSLTSATGNGIHTGIIYFPNTPGASFKFKITPQKKWDVAYGDAGGGKISTSGGDITGPGAGSYRLTVDMNLLTIEFAKDSWGVIGDATPGGWGADTDLIYNNTTGTWSVTLPLTAAKYKFRYNDDWGTNLGGSGGTLTPGGADISVAEAGTYKIVLDVTAQTYTITKQP